MVYAQSREESKTHKILHGFKIPEDHPTLVKRPDVPLIKKENIELITQWILR